MDEQGEPIIEVDQDMTRAEYEARVAGQYACISCSMLRPISSEAIDRALS